MGEAVIALLILAGGFAFVEIAYTTRYRATRADGQRLLFYSACSAFFLLVLARILLTLAARSGWYEPLRSIWLGLLPQPVDGWLGTAFVSVLLGVAAAKIVNRFYSEDKATSKAIREHGTEMEKLFHAAIEKDAMVSITLRNRKVYVGLVARTPPILEGRSTDIRLLPVISGYREEKTLDWIATTTYDPIYSKIIEGAIVNLTLSDFEVVIPTGDIVTANFFSTDLDQKLFKLGA